MGIFIKLVISSLSTMDKFQKRIGFLGNLEPILEKTSTDYKLGRYVAHTVIPVGYEDYNLILRTNKRKYFVKIFAAYRSREDCKRYITIICKILKNGVRHPRLLKSSQGELFTTRAGSAHIRLCVMEYVDGKSLYASKANLTLREQKFVIKEAALINKIKIKPKFIYDSWAVSNILKEYKKKRRYLTSREKKIIDRLAKKFSAIPIKRLPHCLVHGDIIKTNVLRDAKGRLYIIDFSVANYYPRIQELAVLLCSVLFDERHPEAVKRQRQFALQEYRKYISLSNSEVLTFPLFCDVAHAMHVIQASYEEKAKGNESEENRYWLKLGRAGLGVVSY